MKEMKFSSNLVEIDWLAENLQGQDLVLLDASILPVGRVESKSNKKYIPNSAEFDFDKDICDKSSPLPHMLPTAANFEQAVRKIGVNSNSLVVVYDNKGIYSSARAWWMFKIMGHKQVAVLNGGLPAWIAANQLVDTSVPKSDKNGNFRAVLQPAMLADAKDVEKFLLNPACAVVDARSKGRFQGTEPEPRQGLRGGHMPHSINVPFNDVLANGYFKDKSDLKKLFQSKVGERKHLVFSCGSGVTAAIAFLAAALAGYENLSLYDGSWSEWGQPSSRPVVTGTD